MARDLILSMQLICHVDAATASDEVLNQIKFLVNAVTSKISIFKDQLIDKQEMVESLTKISSMFKGDIHDIVNKNLL